jgi:3-hydroxyisobutyrate dehydrogenase-like beta-hydroxyacid dehydrogenase
MKSRIAVLGTGRMGSALASAFLAQGHPVTVWNRTAARAQPLEAKGARVAASVEEAVAAAELVIGNVNDYATCAALLEPAPVARALRGKLFVQLTTGSPQQAREGAAWAQSHGISYLAGAIMATPDFIGQPGCTLLYAGSPQLFEAHKAALLALGDNTLFVGTDPGHAGVLDAALLMVLWGSAFGTWQAAAICEAEGFALDAFSSSLVATMPVIQASLVDAIERIPARRFKGDETTMATVATCHASVRLIHQISQQHGIHTGLTAALDKIFSRAVAAGHLDGDLAAVYTGMRD